MLRVFIISAIIFIAPSALLGQSGGQTGNISTKKFGQQNVPIWRSKADSIKAKKIDEEIETTLKAFSSKSRGRLDSLMKQRSVLYQEGITGFRKLFFPSRGFLSVDSVMRMPDKTLVTKISIIDVAEIPSVLYECKNVEFVELINTRLNKLPEELNLLKNIQTLYIFNNKPRKSLELPLNNTVKTLVMRGDDPKQFPKSYVNFMAMTKLDLSENALKRFPNGSRRNKNLEELHLQRNELTLRGSMRRHPYLDQLLLQFNAVTNVPRKIKRFPDLKKLTFNTNKVVSVSPGISKLKKLEHLSFYKNQLKSIPKGVYNLPSLREIDLFYNEIERLDPGFVQWKNLRSLYLSFNKIISLPENIDALASLDGLYVWDNRLTALPESIGKLQNLRYLRVNGNYIKVIPTSLFDLKNLEELNLSKNQIVDLPEEVFNFPKIKILVLENNPWNVSTEKLLIERAEELRKRDVFVHITAGEQ